MRKLIIGTAALAFLSSGFLASTALAQDKSGTAPAATKSDTMSKGETSKMSHTKSKKTHKSATKSTDDTMKKQ